MKKITLSIIFLLIISLCHAQVEKERLDKGTVGVWDGEEWQWTEWEECNLICVIDWGNDNVKIYSNTVQDYDMIDSEEERVDESGWTTFQFTAIDTEGVKCGFAIMRDKNLDRWIGIEYSDTRVMYHIKK